MKAVSFGVFLFMMTLFFGCEESRSNVYNLIPEDNVKNVPHPIPAPSIGTIESDEFPPRAPSI